MTFRNFNCFLLVYLIPIWSFDHFLTQDGPIHLANAWSFFHYDDPASELLREYYVRNPVPAPNWFVQAIAGLLLPIAGAATAEKLIATGFVFVLPGSVWYAAEGLRKGTGSIAVLACPFVFTWFLNTGLYNFCFGIALHFLLLGYWLRVRDQLEPYPLIVVGAGLVALYFTHIFALAGFLLTLGMLIAIDRRKLVRTIVTTGLAALPAFALVAVFVHSKQSRLGPPVRSTAEVADRLLLLLNQEQFVSRFPEEAWLYGAASLLIWGTFAWAAHSVVRAERLRPGLVLTIPLALMFLYFSMPLWALQGAFIPERLLYLAFLSAVAFSAPHWPEMPGRKPVMGVAAALSLALVGVQTASAFVQNEGAEPILACARDFERGSTLLPVGRPEDLGGSDDARLDALRHVTHYWVIEHQIVNLGNFSAYRRNHPMLYRPGLAPLPKIGCPECNPPTIDLASYSATTGRPVDYILLRGSHRELRLGSGYESVCLREDNGRVELFRRKGSSRHSGSSTRDPG